MDANDDAENLTPRGALGFFASSLAPTQMGWVLQAALRCSTINRTASAANTNPMK